NPGPTSWSRPAGQRGPSSTRPARPSRVNGRGTTMTETARGRVRVETSPKRVRTYVDGEVVADSRRPLLVWEGPHYPIYYFPLADVRAMLAATGDSERSPSRGTGEVYDVVTSRRTVPAAAKRY